MKSSGAATSKEIPQGFRHINVTRLEFIQQLMRKASFSRLVVGEVTAHKIFRGNDQHFMIGAVEGISRSMTTIQQIADFLFIWRERERILSTRSQKLLFSTQPCFCTCRYCTFFPRIDD